MATKRHRGNGKWQYIVKRKQLLPKPITMTFDSEQEGDAYIAELEILLDKGIVPHELLGDLNTIKLHSLIDNYIKTVDITNDDRQLLALHKTRLANIDVNKITYQWSEFWVRDLKKNYQLSPSTISKHVGALARCLDWGLRHEYLPANPLRSLPKGYARYNSEDIKQAGVKRVDISRDRRLEVNEEVRILNVIRGQVYDSNQQQVVFEHAEAVEVFFLLALETAMRMREMYTLELTQIDLNQKTIFLDKTKNGDKRQVPLSKPALKLLKDYMGTRINETYLFPWYTGKSSATALKRMTSKLSQRWNRIFKLAKCDDLRFHDLRHEATSRIYERTVLSDLEISKITGHKNMAMLRRYANLRGSELADKLW